MVNSTEMGVDKLAFVDGIEELSAIPTVAMDLMAMLNDPATRVKEVVDELKLDPAMTAFILKYCNSPLLGLRSQVNSITHALNLIGFTRCKSILMSYFFRNLYNISGKKYITNYLWEHSLTVAIVAREMSEQLNLGESEEDMEVAYIAGLLHDIGKLAIYVHTSDAYEKLMHRADLERTCFLPMENQMLGYNHAEVGARLLEKWKFSELMIQVARHHHTQAEENDVDKVVGLIAFANHTVHYAITKQEDLPHMFLSRFRLSAERYHYIVEGLYNTVAESHLIHMD